MTKHGTLIVVSAPSGAGKHTILRRVLDRDANLEYSVSATTRAPRAGEVDGREYYFLTEAAFQERVDAGEFFEWAEVHGHRYGTLKSELTRRIESGCDVVLELDVQGKRNLAAIEPDLVSVFIMAPSLAEIERRLRNRGANTEEDIALRLRNARNEIAAAHEYDYLVVNDVLDDAVADLQAIVRAQRCRSGKYPAGFGL